MNLTGFKELLEQIEKAGGNVDNATMRAVQESAQVVESELRNACNAAGVPSSVTSEITTEVTQSGNRTSAKVGWSMGNYDPKNPSAGYKAVFLNYGTPKRTVKKDHIHHELTGGFVTLGKDRGQIAPRGFIGAAKKASGKKVKKKQEELLQEILKGLEES